ncbi:MAG: hypothetical protein OEV85_11405 [Candidatus Thorarchaeota archaeon]|nr:hypothetical protein [Candidatus Thorarchaeota archaeon]
MTYLLVAFSFFQVTILSIFVMQKIKDALTPEEHFAMRKSALLLGYIWLILLYIPVVAIWVVDLWQIQIGVAWPMSNYTPDAVLLLLVLLVCMLHFPLTLYALYWQWDCFTTREDDMKLVLNKGLFKTRSTTTFFTLAFVFVLFFGLKSAMEREFLLPLWLNPLTLALFILLLMITFTLGLWYRYRRNHT